MLDSGTTFAAGGQPAEDLRLALHNARLAHDDAVRALNDRPDQRALALDLDLWEALGAALAELAQSARAACARSHFCNARPDAAQLTARLSEAIDDQLDAPAWAVMDAAARLHLAPQRMAAQRA
ncbi:MAG: hypothetical protein P4L64_09095 [Caulobacteraceae bacterium]|nr:hypothetical protein [Caulobacteraceae bacterium]